QAEDGIRVFHVTGVQTCALPIFSSFGTCICWLILPSGVFHPSKNFQTGRAVSSTLVGETKVFVSPFLSYAVQIGTSDIPFRISALVSTRSVTPFNIIAYFKVGRSSQPTLRGRLVLDPNSSPFSRNSLAGDPVISVGKIPFPTRVQ